MLRRVQKSARQLVPTHNSLAAMSTFTLPGSASVAVSLPDNLEKDQLLSFPAFKNWHAALTHNLDLQHSNSEHEFHKSPYALKKIDVQAVDWFGGGKRLGFVKLTAEIKNTNDESLPGSVFLRGASVGMLVLLQPDDVPEASQEELHALLTVQARIPAASLSFAELPAGMVDDGTFSGAAAKEIEEELSLKIPEDKLINLTELAIEKTQCAEELPRAIFPSAGGSDEHIPIFMHLRRVPRETLEGWTGKLTGLRESGEKITLKLIKLEDLWREGARDAKALCAYALYTGLKAEGKI